MLTLEESPKQVWKPLEVVPYHVYLSMALMGRRFKKVWVYLKKSPKWFPYGVALSMALTGRHFEEVYKKPWKYG
jgi:hypothetical protein